ncbi:cupin domain-containing protein [Nocardioides sp. YIM 152315]|uniref:cupin domain-containing protein n=1 Tax=Nocardioides sp. YIM 152315 TaxID=3031760 RepID=UPI0023DA305B|nr:cupin domain-containing protein [Nocardioides sp. YIM 152315]MDF1605524.1 cupin domain-containing protein [Nocardioides sp. YIM 152315]
MTHLISGPVVGPGDTEVLEHLDMLCRVALSGSDTGGAFSLVEERARLGAGTPRHVHTREAETFMVLDGALEGWCDGTATLVEAGSMIHLPAGLEHAFRIASETAHFYMLVTPSGFESFFRATGHAAGVPFEGELPVPAPVPPEAVARLQEVLDPLGVTVTGPPPFAP